MSWFNLIYLLLLLLTVIVCIKRFLLFISSLFRHQPDSAHILANLFQWREISDGVRILASYENALKWQKRVSD